MCVLQKQKSLPTGRLEYVRGCFSIGQYRHVNYAASIFQLHINQTSVARQLHVNHINGNATLWLAVMARSYGSQLWLEQN